MKGTPSQGKHARSKTHIICRRCGNVTRKKKGSKACSSCGFGGKNSSRMRSYAWSA